jgi:hypothetical protein
MSHMWKGIIQLSPAQAQSLGLPPPPVNHDPPEPPAGSGIPRAYNSWAVVPATHVLAHLANLPASKIKHFDYTVYQLALRDSTRIPFLLMDLWTLDSYARSTCSNAIIKIAQDRVSIPDIFIELVPLKNDTWLNSCMAGQHFQVSFLEMCVCVCVCGC